MKKLMFVFPGQGSQVVGMAKEFMENRATAEVFEEADSVLGFHLARLMREGSEDELRLTHNAQPALLVAGYAAMRYVASQMGDGVWAQLGAVAGHSLGEYTAVAAAGGMPFADAVALVRLRGEAMTAAVPAGQGAMLAVLGLDMATVAEVATTAGVWVANDNSDGQVILSGEVAGIEKAEVAAKDAGAKRVLRLNVSGPFHTPLMQPAAVAVAGALSSITLQPLRVPCLANARAALVLQPEDVKQGLVAQITQTVRWRESMKVAADMGIEQVVELGVGKVLAGLAPRCDSRLKAVSLDSPAAVDAWVEAFAV